MAAAPPSSADGLFVTKPVDALVADTEEDGAPAASARSARST